jgi:hypothetical protein
MTSPRLPKSHFHCAVGHTSSAYPADPEVYAGLGAVYRSFARVGELEAPTVAAVRGGAWAPVSRLMLATDVRIVARAGADPELARRTAASLRTVLGPPPLPWPAALELERALQMWSMRRKALG